MMIGGFLFGLLVLLVVLEDGATVVTAKKIVIQESTVWTEDVILRDDDEVVLLPHSTLTIRGNASKPLTVWFLSQGHRKIPTITLQPHATIVVEHTTFESNNTAGDSASGIKLGKGCNAYMSHWTCRNMGTCMSTPWDSGGSSGTVQISDSVVVGSWLGFYSVHVTDGFIRDSLFLNHWESALEMHAGDDGVFEIQDSFFVNSSAAVRGGISRISGSWFIANNSSTSQECGAYTNEEIYCGAALDLHQGLVIENCAFARNSMAVTIQGGDAEMVNVTFWEDNRSLSIRSKDFKAEGINIVGAKNYSVIAIAWLEDINATHWYWGPAATDTEKQDIRGKIYDTLSPEEPEEFVSEVGIVQIDPIATAMFPNPLLGDHPEEEGILVVPTHFQGRPFASYARGKEYVEDADDNTNRVNPEVSLMVY